MKVVIASILLLISHFTCLSQKRDSVLIKNDIYTIIYSEVLEQPLNVRYRVRCNEGNVSRSGMDFYREKGVHTSDESDYENNTWDKGHCAPAADFNCDRNALNATFSYVNCVLQHERLNRGVWKSLENYERELSKRYRVDVEIIVVFSKNSVRLPTGATVPEGFWKKIRLNGRLKECYYFNNEIPKEVDHAFYRMKCKN